MKTFKKIIAFTLATAMVAAVSVGATVAYLQDEDSDVNVMTLGNVQIEQHEYERIVKADGKYEMITTARGEGYKVQEFSQAKPLYPAVGEVTGWDDTKVYWEQLGKADGYQSPFAGLNNVQDKFVLVENTGKSDAYVRTIIAYEVGTATDAFDDLIMTSYAQFWTENLIGVVEINGNNYYVVEYIYNGSDVRHIGGILPAGDYTYNSLAQVYMASKATNEDVEAIDGNDNGTYDILVVSQAIQTEGFATAEEAFAAGFPFGEGNANVPGWFGDAKMTVNADSVEEIKDALATGGFDVVIDLGGKEIPGEDEDPVAFYNIRNKVEIRNGGIKAGTASDYALIGRAGSETTINDVDLNSAGGGIAAANGAKVIFNSGSVYVDTASTSGRYVFYLEGEGSEIEINGGEFSWDPADNQKRAYIYAGAGTTAYVNGGTFGKASSRSGYTAGILGDGEVIIKGGTFGFNPSNWVAEGYQAVQNGSTWTVSAVAAE